MDQLDLPSPQQIPPEATNQIIDAYSSSVMRSIFTKFQKYIDKSKSPSTLMQQEAKQELEFDEHELLFMKKHCCSQVNEVRVETPKECTIGNGDKQLKVKLDILHKMKEKKLMTEVVDSSKEELPSPPPGGSGCAPEIRNLVNKNAYEIRLEILKEAVSCSNNDPVRALKIAENFYTFVENRRRA